MPAIIMEKIKPKLVAPKMKSERSKTPTKNLNCISMSFSKPEVRRTRSKSPMEKKYISNGKLDILKKNLKQMLEKDIGRSKSRKTKAVDKSKNTYAFQGGVEYCAKQLKDLKQLYKNKDYLNAIKLADIMLLHNSTDTVVKYLKANSHMMLEEYRTAVKVR